MWALWERRAALLELKAGVPDVKDRERSLEHHLPGGAVDVV
jgi:hypothetical protein